MDETISVHFEDFKGEAIANAVYDRIELEEQLLSMMSHIPKEDRSGRTLEALRKKMLASAQELRSDLTIGMYEAKNVVPTILLHETIAQCMDKVLESLVADGYLNKIPLS